jgi:putative nucleotidyltransferase with HDIG domain
MKDLDKADELVRRLAAATRAASLYSPDHPLVRRGVDALAGICAARLQKGHSVVIGFLEGEIVVDGARLTKSAAALAGFLRDLREREIEKITITMGVTRDELRTFVAELADRASPVPLPVRIEQRGFHHLTVGRIVIDEESDESGGIAAARRVYHSAVQMAESLWDATKAGEKPDPVVSRRIIDSLAKLVTRDRTSLMALTALKKYDNYTFTHMVNVSVLSMAQARTLNLEGAMLREFGFAALMHDIGKVHTPLEVLNKPDKLTKDEFEIMKRHVIDGAQILRRTPEMPALAPVVAFEHHLREDLSGYPEHVGHRDLNLCTMIVMIADVYDALRSNRVYREGLPTDRIKAIMGKQGSNEFNGKLLRRFVNLIGMYPVGTLVRLNTEEIGVVTHEHPTDPFRPQVKVLLDAQGQRLEEAPLLNTWERDARGEFPRAVVEAVDPDQVAIDPIEHM